MRTALSAVAAVAALALVGCAPSEPRQATESLRAETLRRDAEAGDVAGVRAALDGGADVDVPDADGATALVRAAYANQVEAAAVLIEAGGDVDHQDSTRQSAYLIATSEVGDDPRLLRLCLDAGAQVDAKDSYNGTGLIRAAHRGHARIVDELIAAGIELDHVNRLGWTALLEAVILGDGGPAHQAVVRSLVAAGADTSVGDRDGRTALQHARDLGQLEVADLLAKSS